MVKDIQAGKKPEINDDKSYNNRVKTVPRSCWRRSS